MFIIYRSSSNLKKIKTFVFFVCVSLVLTTAFSATSFGNYNDLSHPGKCVIRPDLILSPGTHQDPSGCGRVLCRQNGLAEFQSCGVRKIYVPGCTSVSVETDDVYPDCCKEKLICPNNLELDKTII